MGRSSRTLADKEKSRIENGRERTRLYRRNFSGKKKCEVLEKDGLRKRNNRKETVLSEEEKRNIRENNRFRKQKERRKIDDKIEKEKDGESGSSSQHNGDRLYTVA